MNLTQDQTTEVRRNRGQSKIKKTLPILCHLLPFIEILLKLYARSGISTLRGFASSIINNMTFEISTDVLQEQGTPDSPQVQFYSK